MTKTTTLSCFEVAAFLMECGHVAIVLTLNEEYAAVISPEDTLELAKRLREAMDTVTESLEATVALKGKPS